MEPILQTTFTQKYCFPEPPPAHIRRMLIDAGYKFDGVCWSKTIGTASTLSNSEMMYFLNGDIKNIRDSGLAPSDATL